MLPWLRSDFTRIVYWPLVQLFWLVKCVAVLEAAINPKVAFRMSGQGG